MKIYGVFATQIDSEIAANNLEEADYKYKEKKLKKYFLITVDTPEESKQNAIEILTSQNAKIVKNPDVQS